MTKTILFIFLTSIPSTLVLYVLLKGLPEDIRKIVEKQTLIVRLNETTLIEFNEKTSDVKEDIKKGIRGFTQRCAHDVSYKKL